MLYSAAFVKRGAVKSCRVADEQDPTRAGALLHQRGE